MPPNIRQTKIWENIIIRSIVSSNFLTCAIIYKQHCKKWGIYGSDS